MLYRKDYRAFAQAVQNVRDRKSLLGVAGASTYDDAVERIILELSDVLASIKGNFDRARFEQACYNGLAAPRPKRKRRGIPKTSPLYVG